MTKLLRTALILRDLERRGCQILGVNSHITPPHIRIAPPPEGAFDTYASVRPPHGAVSGVPVAFVSVHRGARIEWFDRRERW